MSKLQIGAHRAPIHESAFIRVYLRLENSIQVFVADFCVVSNMALQLSEEENRAGRERHCVASTRPASVLRDL